MRAYTIAALIASTSALTLQQMNAWPSVARCRDGQISTDREPCDQDNRTTHRHDNTANSKREFSALQMNQEWPSVARCRDGQISTDREPCDQDNRTTHRHDNTANSKREFSAIYLGAEWPSVARCRDGQISTDREPCDQDNRTTHRHDNTVASSREFIQLSEEWRPVIKCKDPIHGNPITCDHDDITAWGALPKDENGFTPTKVVLGGPSYGEKEPESTTAAEEDASNKEEAKK